MANPFDTLITADFFKNQTPRQGGNALVYQHPTDENLMIRVPKRVANNFVPLKTEPLPVNLPQAYAGKYGLPVARTSDDIQIMNKVQGEHPKTLYDKMSNREYISNLNKLRKLPQEAYNNFRADLKNITNGGGYLDSHPENVLIGKNKITPIDVGEVEDFTMNNEGRGYNPNRWANQKSTIKDTVQSSYLTGVSSKEDALSTIPQMFGNRRNAAINAINTIYSKLGAASKFVPALSIPGALDIGNRMNNVVSRKTTPMQEYADMIGVRTYNPIKDWI